MIPKYRVFNTQKYNLIRYFFLAFKYLLVCHYNFVASIIVYDDRVYVNIKGIMENKVVDVKVVPKASAAFNLLGTSVSHGW